MSDVKDRIIEIIAKECEIDPATITPESTLESLGVSSVDLVQVMFQIEEAFDIYLADDDMGFDVKNVGEVIASVEKRVGDKTVGA